MNAEPSQSLDSHDRASFLLSQAGFDGPFSLLPVQGGANSKTFRVEWERADRPLFFKEYFKHPQDSRDRLGTEYAFACFAYDTGLRTLARPYAMNREHGCALYSFIDGKKLSPNEITIVAVRQCLSFFRAINAHKETPRAAALPIASEGCFSLEDHWECLRRRLRRLETMQPENDIDREARTFVVTRLARAASEYFSLARAQAEALRLDCHETIRAADRCLSPSDFGFHNALQAVDGSLSFLDFEYAGWDDPAKTVCDFFCQPAYPVPIHYWSDFAGEIAKATTDPIRSAARFALLLPMYRLKWCCIMLNDFLPAGAGRRRFAISDIDETNRKKQQLQKACKSLQQYDAAWSVNHAA